jgi:NAD(P)-dependent dehydrogenase (short-subunit alcohol dehydrogenase family)
MPPDAETPVEGSPTTPGGPPQEPLRRVGRGLLAGQVAIITGAGQGLGRAIAIEFAGEGATVALIGRTEGKLANTAASIEAGGGRAIVLPLDVTDYQAYGSAIDEVVRATGRIDVLVNNAAISQSGTILEDSLEAWRSQMAVNLEALYMGTKLVVPHMVERRSGRIINITSIQGFVSSGDIGSYNAAKGGIIAYTKSLAVELAPYGIVANAIAPGFLWTPLSIVDGIDETTTEEFQTWYVGKRKIPMGRTGYPDDAAGAAVFLASDYCRYMTGHVLVVDGGLTSTF